uniref:Uncharacterized protein n=1 Tax=Leptobrachium leishanense TaxID=445787 RepID=A0A8C5R073_9ANUR
WRADKKYSSLAWLGSALGEDRRGSALGEDRRGSALGEDRRAAALGEDRRGSALGEDRRGSALGIHFVPGFGGRNWQADILCEGPPQ